MSAGTGAALLDRVWVPSWPTQINQQLLDMGDPALCVLAQLCTPGVLAAYMAAPLAIPHTAEPYARYAAMAQHLSGQREEERAVRARHDGLAWAVRYGFMADRSCHPADLTRDWIGQITARTRKAGYR